MAASYFFYDLETTGVDPRAGRVMQFAGQRTDMDLKPVGEPINELIKLTPDVVPQPDAILITGITPQSTLTDGLTEAEFLKLFHKQVCLPDTTFIGFNNVRFDDEFMRFMLYRNFYDAYEWQWFNGCSRWDLLDVVRMTRALRPEGIEWPFAPDGKPTNRLEFLTKVNGLDHSKAHDALDDVRATIAVAQLIRAKQPDLFDYLAKSRSKKAVGAIVESGQPFIYSSGKYPSASWHTTAVVRLSAHPQSGTSLVYDLRHDPTPFLKMSVDEIVAAWRYTRDPEAVRLPVKTIKYNRCPAVAPLGVIKDGVVQERLDLTLDNISKNLAMLKQGHEDFARKVLEALDRLDDEREASQTDLIDNEQTVDSRLYDGFIPDADKQIMRVVRAAAPEELNGFTDKLKDDRLVSLLPLYKARNYPASLTGEERMAWENFCQQQLLGGGSSSRLHKYFARLQELAAQENLSQQKQYLLEELQLYGQSIIPADVTD